MSTIQIPTFYYKIIQFDSLFLDIIDCHYIQLSDFVKECVIFASNTTIIISIININNKLMP